MAKEKTVLEKLGWIIGNSISTSNKARIYEATRKDEPSGKEFALKIVRSEEGKQAYDRFHSEVEALQKITHPNIIQIETHGRDDAEKLHFYVMEFIEGITPLKRFIARRESSPYFGNALEALGIYIQMLEALQACHSQKVLHRDLSPGNVLICPDGKVKLIDFGCCFIEDGRCVTLCDEMVGTQGYRAPECEDGSSEPGENTDLYSAGRLLWSLVTGQNSVGREDVVFRHRPLPIVLPGHPQAWHLHHIFAKTIRKERGHRYKTTTEALEHARSVLRKLGLGYSPVEMLTETDCPMCGFGRLESRQFISDRTLLGDGMYESGRDERMASFIASLGTMAPNFMFCTSCGYAYIRLDEILKRTLDYRKGLE